jgi:hypothetical protein
VRLAGVPLTKIAALLGVESDSFWGYVGIQKPWEDNINKEEQFTLHIEKAWQLNLKDAVWCELHKIHHPQ